MNIAIDFDETLTADPVFSALLIESAQMQCHNVYLVTCRRNTPENQQLISDWLDENAIPLRAGQVVFTSLAPKLDYMARLGITIDIWIDDDPNCILNGK